MSLIMQSSLIFLLVIIGLSTAQTDSTPLINKPLCLSTFCRVKCKRYIIQNGCPTCECNPCVFDQPLNFTCRTGKHECLSNGGLCKVDASSDKISCCPKEHDGCCPYTPNIETNDPDMLFRC